MFENIPSASTPHAGTSLFPPAAHPAKVAEELPQADPGAGGRPARRRSHVTDVLVVGGGIAGASAAFHLACAGVRVTLVERERLAHGITSRAVGYLGPPIRRSFAEVARERGEAAARDLWEFSLRSVEGLCDLVRARGEAETAQLDRSGAYVLADPSTHDEVLSAYQAMLRAGLPVHWVTAADVQRAVGGHAFCGGYAFRGGGSVDPVFAAGAVARAARAAGALIIEGVAARRVQPCPGGFRTATDSMDVLSAAVVHAAHLEGKGLLGDLAAELVPVSAQAFLTAPVPIRFRGAFATDRRMNVWRQRPDGRVVGSGWRPGSQADAGRPGSAIARSLQADVRDWFEATFPGDLPLRLEREWSGVLARPADHLPLVGPVPGRAGEWVVTGFGSEGFAFAFEAGRAVAHAIVGDGRVPGAAWLDPGRLLRGCGGPASPVRGS